MTIPGAQNLTQYARKPAEPGPEGGSVYFVDDFGRAKKLMAELIGLRVVLRADDGKLAYDAPAGAITDDLIARMRANRDGLLALIAVAPEDGCCPRVVHLKREPFDVRIDRQSKWGNPFKIGPDGDRAEVIAKYRAWIIGRPELMAALPELRGKRLGCWCAPLACHGDVLADLVVESLSSAAQDNSFETTIVCPFCRGRDLVDDPRGLRCERCRTLAWHDMAGGGLVRADYAEAEFIDFDDVQCCPSCGRWCDTITLTDAWKCSSCDPDADERRRRTLRLLALAKRLSRCQ